MPTTQEGRLLKLTTPLGDDVLLIKRLRANEGLNQLFQFELDILHDHDTAMSDEPMIADVAQLLGQPMTVSVDQNDGTQRYFNGICARFHQGNRKDRYTKYHAVLVPQIWLLTQKVQSRIFQHIPVPDILQEVFQGFEVNYEIQGTFEPRNYCVQYRESDFDFASRLMEEEGIFYYFEHTNGSHRMIVANTPTSHRPCPSRSAVPFHLVVGTEEGWIASVLSWNVAHQLRTGKYTLWDNNFEIQASHLDAEQLSRFNIGGNQNLEHYDYPGEYAKRFDGVDSTGGDQTGKLNKVFEDRRRVAEIRQQELDVSYKTIRGTSDCCALTGGYRFELSNHPVGENNNFHVLINVQIEAVQTPSYASEDVVGNPYIASFSCIPYADNPNKAPFRPLRKIPKPIMHGTQTAIVVGPSGEEIFTDKYGRVKVQFYWDREGRNDAASSCWLRVATSIAGNKWGTMFIPRIGQEVVVDFMEGDPDQPIIVGSVYNPQTMPHYELPKFKTLSYFKSRTSPDDGKGFNEIRFEDKQGKEQVFIHSQKRMDTRVKGSFYETCGGNRQEVIGMRSDDKPGGNLAVSVGGNYDLHVKGDQFIGIDGKLNETVKADHVQNIQGKQAIVVTGTSELNAQKITLEALQQITLKVGASFITLDLTGITIQAPMVKINSGGSATGTSPVDIEDPLDAESADTGEPGYLDRPRSGGGRRGRNRRTLNGQHGPEATRDENGVYHVGNIAINEGSRNPNFQRDTLNDIAIIGTTDQGQQTLDNIQDNPNGNQVTIVERNNPADPTNGGATAANPTNAGNGTGSNSTIDYDPTVYPVANSTDPRSQHNTTSDSILHHELTHADHHTNGTRDGTRRTDCFTTNEEFNTIGNPGGTGPDNTYRRERGLEERNDHKDY